MWALVAYHAFTVAPVALQAGVQFSRSTRSISRSYFGSLLSRDDLYHLLLKESFRSFLGGGLAVYALSQAPDIARHWNYPVMLSIGIVFAYMFSDMLYCFVAQCVSRLLVIMLGRFWFIGGGSLSYKQEQNRENKGIGKKTNCAVVRNRRNGGVRTSERKRLR